MCGVWGEGEKGHPSTTQGVQDRSQPGPHLLPRPSQAKSAWQRLILNPRRKPLPRECQVRPEDTNICSASALLIQIRHLLWGRLCGKEVGSQ